MTDPVLDGKLVVETRSDNLLAVTFNAMASDCEILLPAANEAEALEVGLIAAREAWRIEKKYSRYRDDSVVSWLQANRGRTVVLDEETASLINFSAQCFELSEGLFDITSGILRHAWRFDGSDRIPQATDIEPLLTRVGFHRLQWQSPCLTLPPGMELDFGGIGKEYAVDRAYALVAASHRGPFLVNFGGDLRASGPPPHGPWQVGIERPDADHEAQLLLDLEHGALATSGDARRFLVKDGVRYGHILNPLTGWPSPDSPRSITVAGSCCTEAGLLSTVAMLHGAGAQAYLEEQGAPYWIIP